MQTAFSGICDDVWLIVLSNLFILIAQLAGAIEYTNHTSAESKTLSQRVS